MVDADTTHYQVARTSYVGQKLTENQFEKGYAYVGALRSDINASGSFIESLTEHAVQYQRNERFDVPRAETILRDLYKARFGESMNQTRERLLNREDTLTQDDMAYVVKEAVGIENRIQEGDTIPYYRALDDAGVSASTQLGVTQWKAKELLNSGYAMATGRDLYEDGKTWEAQYHIPVREAARKERAAARAQSGSESTKARTRAYAR